MAKPNRNKTDRTDSTAGNEGIDDLAMESGRQQGREAMDDAGTFSGQGNQREGSPNPEGTGYTGNSGNMSGSSRGRTEDNVVERTSEDRDRNLPENAEKNSSAESEE